LTLSFIAFSNMAVITSDSDLQPLWLLDSSAAMQVACNLVAATASSSIYGNQAVLDSLTPVNL
jgi:hypothetical protein